MYIYLVKYFNLNEKFILLKNSSDRIGIIYRNSDRIRIRQFRRFKTLGNCRIINVQSDPINAHLYYLHWTPMLVNEQQFMLETHTRLQVSHTGSETIES